MLLLIAMFAQLVRIAEYYEYTLRVQAGVKSYLHVSFEDAMVTSHRCIILSLHVSLSVGASTLDSEQPQTFRIAEDFLSNFDA